jgi:hypothetical protein
VHGPQGGRGAPGPPQAHAAALVQGGPLDARVLREPRPSSPAWNERLSGAALLEAGGRAMLRHETSPVSRMWEIRTHGSKRGSCPFADDSRLVKGQDLPMESPLSRAPGRGRAAILACHSSCSVSPRLSRSGVPPHRTSVARATPVRTHAPPPASTSAETESTMMATGGSTIAVPVRPGRRSAVLRGRSAPSASGPAEQVRRCAWSSTASGATGATVVAPTRSGPWPSAAMAPTRTATERSTKGAPAPATRRAAAALCANVG